jgi:hypothetical protein
MSYLSILTDPDQGHAADDGRMGDARFSGTISTIRLWAVVVAGAAVALLLAWLGRLAGVPLSALLSIGAAAVALAWLMVLVAVPWNLYFAARRVVTAMAVSRERGITLRPDQDAEAERIARRMLRFALGGHVGTAAAAAVISYFAHAMTGYYVAGFYLLSAAVRPAVAYFAHLRERITVLTRESAYPREDVISLQARMDSLTGATRDLQAELRQAHRGVTDDLRRVESALAGDITHARQLLTADLARLQDAQAADRAAASSRDDQLGHRIDQMVRRIEDTLDGISDHQELLTGIRALARMIRSDGSD